MENNYFCQIISPGWLVLPGKDIEALSPEEAAKEMAMAWEDMDFMMLCLTIRVQGRWEFRVTMRHTLTIEAENIAIGKNA